MRIGGDHIAGCLTVQQAAWASAGVQFVWTVLIMLLIIVPATVLCLMLSPTSSSQFQFKVQAKTFLANLFLMRSLQVLHCKFIASVSGVQCTEVQRGNVVYYPLGRSLPEFFKIVLI